MKVLIVDDSLLVRNSLKRIILDLGSSDAMILAAKDGKAGLELFKKEAPDILILDLLMPVMDGTEVMRHLKEMNHNAFIAILSSNFQKPVKERLLGLGANLFVEKPMTNEKADLILKEYQKWNNS